MNEIDELVDVCDKFLMRRSPLSRVRQALRDGDGPGFDPLLWKEEAELGMTSVGVAERLGGLGAGLQGAGRVLEMCGRYITLEPFVSTVGLAQPLLAESRAERAGHVLKASMLGEAVIAVATPSSADLGSTHYPVRAHQVGGTWYLNGACPVVVDAPIADELIVPATTVDGTAWFLLNVRSFTTTAQGTLLDGRRAAAIRFDNVRVEASDVLAAPPEGAALTESLLTTGAVLVSSWLLGVASEVFSITLEHLRTRKQFGVALGSFQALQHRMAHLFCELTVGRAVIESAQSAIESKATNAALLASCAKSRIGAAAAEITDVAIQYHGGMGMTEESNVGLYFKAARMGEVIAGNAFLHRSRAARLLGLRQNETRVAV